VVPAFLLFKISSVLKFKIYNSSSLSCGALHPSLSRVAVHLDKPTAFAPAAEFSTVAFANAFTAACVVTSI
jgi:hypothetical protein